MGGTAGIWIGFVLLIAALLALDLGVLHRRSREQSLREAMAWSAGWIALALLFNAGILLWWDAVFPGHEHPPSEAALLFLTGYLIELSLSVDNLFVIALLFASFGVPPAWQRRVLLWGILGALAMRGAMIAGGVALLDAFHWIPYAFGGLLVVAGARMLRPGAEAFDPARSRLARMVRRVLPIAPAFEGERFFVRRDGVLMATPLFLVLVLIEGADLVFAVDSIPAIFGVTRDPFLVYASNAFAVLGLRSLFFVLAGFMGILHYLKPALAAILVFVGGKMLLSGVWHPPPQASLAVVAAILAIALALSLRKVRQLRRSGPAGDQLLGAAGSERPGSPGVPGGEMKVSRSSSRGNIPGSSV